MSFWTYSTVTVKESDNKDCYSVVSDLLSKDETVKIGLENGGKQIEKVADGIRLELAISKYSFLEFFTDLSRKTGCKVHIEEQDEDYFDDRLYDIADGEVVYYEENSDDVSKSDRRMESEHYICAEDELEGPDLLF